MEEHVLLTRAWFPPTDYMFDVRLIVSLVRVDGCRSV